MIYKFNQTEVNTENFTLFSNKKEVPVEPQVFNLIVFLIENNNQIVSREQLLDHVWQGRVVSDTSINNNIKSARKVLDDDGNKQQVIKTIHSRGYQFIADIKTIAQTAPKTNPNKQLTPPIKQKQTSNMLFKGFLVSSLIAITISLYSFFSGEKLFKNEPQDTTEKSIAVLAFQDMSPESDQAYFSDGISEELLNIFTKIPDLRVASRTSSFSFKNKEVTIKEIGKELNVNYVLEGSVRKSGDKLRITVQLIKVENGAHLWSETYDHDFTDIFKIQDEIAVAVSEQLKTKLQTTDIRTNPVNQEAYTLYLQAIYLLKENTEESIKKATTLIGRSIALDSNYAPAWTVYSRILYTVVIYSYKKQIPGIFTLSKTAALKAIQIDKTYAKGYAQLALINLLEWDTNAAQTHIDQAMKLNSKDSSIVGVAAYNLQLSGQLAAGITMLENAIKLDPLNDVHYLSIGIAYLLLNRLEEAEQAIAKYGFFHPNAVAHHAMMSHILLAMGKNEEALAEAKLEVNEYWQLSTMSFATFATGDIELANKLLNQYIADYGDSIPGHIASLYAFRGEKDKAFNWLEIAYQKQDAALLHIINFQTLRNLWDDPRWPIFLAKLNLKEGHWLIDKRLDG